MSSVTGTSSSQTPAVSKSYGTKDVVKDYCIKNSTPLHPVQKKLFDETLKHKWGRMMGAPEVISMNALLIRSLLAKKVIDVGVFTGASTLAAALALPEDGKVVACDVSKEFTDIARGFWAEAGVENKINLVLAPATQTLQALVDQGEAGTFDFAFIDADKTGYDSYYELCLRLMRKGGIVAIDNTLWSGRVLDEEDNTTDTIALKQLNNKLAKDDRVMVVQVNVGDGYTMATKL